MPPNAHPGAIALAAALLAPGPGAIATIECDDPTASIELTPAIAPPSLTSGDFSFLCWIHPTELGSVPRSILEIEGGVRLAFETNGSISASTASASRPHFLSIDSYSPVLTP